MATACRAASASISGKVSRVRPQLAGPAHLWCEITSGTPALNAQSPASCRA